MARFLVTPYKASDNTTGAAQLYMAAAGSYGEKLTSSGFYIKTGGASRIDPSRIILLVSKNSSQCTSAGIISIVSGSTAGNADYFPGGYSTLNNLNITIPTAAGYKYGGISGHSQVVPIFIGDVAKYLDTDDYLKFNVSTKLSSIRNAACSKGCRIAAIYIAKSGH